MGRGDSRSRFTASVVVLVGLLALIPASAAARSGSAARGPRLTVSSPAVDARGTVELRGSGWSCRHPVRLEAYVDGVSPYASQDIGVAAPAGGFFSKRWKVPELIDSLPWTVQAVQRCRGGGQRVVTVPLRIRASATRSGTAGVFGSLLSAIAAAAGATTVDRTGLQYIADNEGYKLNSQGQYVVYNDPLGFCTAGYGHLLHKSNCTAADRAGPFNNLTPSQAVALLQKDANRFAAYIVRRTQVPLNQAQLDALVDFAFNVGMGAYGDSTLLKLLNQGKVNEVPAQLARWVHGTVGKRANKHTEVIKGLVVRRGTESRMWTNGQFPPAKHPLPTGGSQPPPPTPVVHVQVDPFRMVFNNGTVQGAGTVTSDPAGISCSVSRDFAATAPSVSGTCAASFPGGTHLTLTATADPQSSVFHGWSDAYGRQASASDPCYAHGTGPCELTLGSSGGGYEVAASFGLQTRVLTIDNPDQVHGEVLASAPTGGQQAICGVEGSQCSVVYPFGQPVNVFAHGQNPPILGFGLEGCDATYPDTQPCQVTMTTSRTLVVNWVRQGG